MNDLLDTDMTNIDMICCTKLHLELDGLAALVGLDQSHGLLQLSLLKLPLDALRLALPPAAPQVTQQSQPTRAGVTERSSASIQSAVRICVKSTLI